MSSTTRKIHHSSTIACRGLLTVMVLIASVTPTLHAQQRARVSPFMLAVGPTWNENLTGLLLRTQYAIVPGRWFGLRVEAGGRWTPTQTFSEPMVLNEAGAQRAGIAQAADIHLGLSATLTAPLSQVVSPYLVLGVAAVQTWSSGTYFYEPPNGPPGVAYFPVSSSSWTRGEIAGIGGLGIRMRLGDRLVQVETRYLAGSAHMYDVTLGTVMRF
jgi:hypothetical protein